MTRFKPGTSSCQCEKQQGTEGGIVEEDFAHFGKAASVPADKVAPFSDLHMGLSFIHSLTHHPSIHPAIYLFIVYTCLIDPTFKLHPCMKLHLGLKWFLYEVRTISLPQVIMQLFIINKV